MRLFAVQRCGLIWRHGSKRVVTTPMENDNKRTARRLEKVPAVMTSDCCKLKSSSCAVSSASRNDVAAMVDWPACVQCNMQQKSIGHVLHSTSNGLPEVVMLRSSLSGSLELMLRFELGTGRILPGHTPQCLLLTYTQR